jgi:hypothetical protein
MCEKCSAETDLLDTTDLLRSVLTLLNLLARLSSLGSKTILATGTEEINCRNNIHDRKAELKINNIMH